MNQANQSIQSNQTNQPTQSNQLPHPNPPQLLTGFKRNLAKHKFGRRLLAKLNQRFVKIVPEQTSFTMILDTQDQWGVSKYLLKHGNYDPEMSLIAKALVTPQSVCLDIGANIGYWSNFLAIECQAKHVIAVEPEPLNQSLLDQNLSANQVHQKVSVIRAAAGEAAGTVDLHLSPDNAGDHQIRTKTNDNPSSQNSPTHHSETRKTVQVPIVRLDDELKKRNFDLESIEFIKIDVQGYEEHVFKGLELVLKNKKLSLIMEWWPEGMIRTGTKPEVFFQFLTDRGFNFRVVDRGLVSNLNANQKLSSSQICDPNFAVTYAQLSALCPTGHHVDLIGWKT